MDTPLGNASLHLNERAAAIADAMVRDADVLGLATSTVEGARVIDCGVSARGGFEAGRLLAEVCLGGAGRVSFTSLVFDGTPLPGVVVFTDHPAVACLGSQYAGWAIQPEGYFAMGSGPIRAIARVERELYEHLGYGEPPTGRGVIVLESRALPSPAAVEFVASRSGLPPSALTFLVAPTASPAAGVQISARVVETALHKVHTLGFDVTKILTGFGTAPLAPIAKNDMRAIGRTNDCVLYGGTAHLAVRAEDAELEALAPRIPSSASRDYGTPFYDVFERYGKDFYKVDPDLFSPAEVFLNNLASGRTFHAGRINADVLRRSLLP